MRAVFGEHPEGERREERVNLHSARERERMKTHAIGREARAHEACVVLGIW